MNEPLVELDSLEKIATELGAITDAHVVRAERKLSPQQETDKALGVLHNNAARRVWALMNVLKAKMEKAAAEQDAALNDIDEQEYGEQVARYGDYWQFARALFWLQVHHDIGYGFGPDSLVIRSGWMVVEPPPRP